MDEKLQVVTWASIKKYRRDTFNTMVTLSHCCYDFVGFSLSAGFNSGGFPRVSPVPAVIAL